MRQIYLDYNSTTPIAPSVQQAMLPFLSEHYGDPSSSHALGRACLEAIEDARSQVASLLNADNEEIVFTSGGTEGNNLAIKGVMLRQKPAAGGHLVISALEHASVTQSAKFLERLGYDLTIVGCGRSGVVQATAIESVLRPDTVLVSVMHANDEIGTLQPVRAICEICHARGVLVHADATQSAGKVRVAVDELGIDLLTITGHKFYGPKGVGALYLRRGTPLEPIQHGTGQEGGLRAGIENVASIVGLGQAASLAAKSMEDSSKRMETLRDRLFKQLRSSIGDRLTSNGAKSVRLPNTLSVNFPDVQSGQLLGRIPELSAWSGASCQISANGMSPTQAAIGLTPDEASGTVRFSLGWYTSEEDIDRASSLLINAWENLR